MVTEEADGDDTLRFDATVGAALEGAPRVKAGVLRRLEEAVGARCYGRLKICQRGYPAVSNWTELEGHRLLKALSNHTRQIFLEDRSPLTAVERAGGHLVGVSRAGGAVDFSLKELGDLYRNVFETGRLKASTRAGYQRSLNKVRVFFVSRNMVKESLPMSTQHFKAMVAEFLLCGETSNTIRNIASAVVEWHRGAGLEPPFKATGEFARIMDTVSVAAGKSRRPLTPINRYHVERLLRLVGLSPAQERSVLMVLTGVVLAGRCEHVANRRICDVLQNFDVDKGPEYAGGGAIFIKRQKQDRYGSGLYPRYSCGPFSQKLSRWIQKNRLEVGSSCEKVFGGNGICRTCPPLFPRYLKRDGSLDPVTPQMVSDGVKEAMRLIGVDPERITGRSMRRGALTAGVKAKVPEEVLYLQSGHGQAKTGRVYINDFSPDTLYATSRAVGL